jgi:nucleoside phosphorylase
MLKILIIEDDPLKRDSVREAVEAVAELPRDTTIDYASTATAARRALAKTHFDVVVLDIALPRNDGSEIDSWAGVSILDELVSRPSMYHVPTHIIGMTGFADVLEAARGRFASALLTLTLYEPGHSEWLQALQTRLRHVAGAVEAIADVALEPKSDVAIVCALPIELAAVLNLPWDWRQVGVRGDPAIYWRGSYRTDQGPRTVYAGLAARMGMPAATAVASKMIQTFRPRFISMTGIAAGIRGRVRLGDIVAADPCWDWGSGKWDLNNEAPRFAAAPYQIPLAPWLRERLRLMVSERDWIDAAVQGWPTEIAANVTLHLGPMASGAAVLADGETARRIVEQNRQLLAIEMEAYGVFAAAEEAATPPPNALVLKGIVDFADGSKNDDVQPFAAHMSAAALRRFCESYI